ncbi:MAG: glycosyltransferase family 4 protein [Chlorobiaceae bacterium]
MSPLPVLFGYHASNLGNSHVPISLCRYWNKKGKKATLSVAGTDDSLTYTWIKPALKGLNKKIFYKFYTTNQIRSITEKRFCKQEILSSHVYLWAGLSLDVFIFFSDKGVKIITERINCHRATSRRLVTDAANILGITPVITITDEDIAEENKKLALADAIFSPSPMVKSSLLENNVPGAKILSSSYGWEPDRFPLVDEPRKKNSRPVFLFVGKLCMRKGIPLLLEAWSRADIDGDLILCGNIDNYIATVFAQNLNKKNIRLITYTNNIGQIYNMADVFVFPSIEEGGPMVTYEAMAHGIPPIVSAMGGGAIVQDKINGLVLSDKDVDAWAAAITELSESPEKRSQLGKNAKLRAQQFTWERVAEQRALLLQNRYPEIWS